MLDIKKNNSIIISFCMSVVMILSILARFSFVISIQISIFSILFILSLYLINTNKIKCNSFILTLIIFFIFCCLSYINADFKTNVRDYLIVLSSILFATFVFSFLSIEFKKKVFVVPIFIALWLSMMLFIRFITNVQGFFDGDTFYEAIALNINVIAGFLVLIYPLIFIFIKEKINTNVFIGMAIFILIAIFLTRCRVAIFSSFILTLILLLEYKKNKYIKFLFFAIISLLIICLIYISFLKSNFNSVSERLIWWKTAYLIFKDNIFFGCGFGNYMVVFKAYRPELVLNTLFAHNIIMQLLAEIGLFGTISFVALLVSFYIKFINRLVEKKEIYFYVSIALSVTFFMLVNLVDYSFFVPANMLMFFIIFSCMFDFKFTQLQKCRVNMYILILISVLLISFMSSLIFARIHYKKGIEFYISKQYKIAIEEFEKAISFDKKNPEYYAQVSKSYFALYDRYRGEQGMIYANKAIEYNKKAIDLCENNGILRSSLSLIYWNIDKKAEAIETMKEAIKYDRYNPYFEEYLYNMTNS